MVATKSRQSKSAKVTPPPTFPFKAGDRIVSRDGKRKGIVKKVGTQKISYQWEGYNAVEDFKIDFESHGIRLDTPQLSSFISRVPLDKIRADGGTQPRAELNEQTVAEYAEDKKQGAEFPPVITFFDGQDYWLADGFHRFNADKLNEAEEIEAIVKQGTQRDAILYSVGANSSHGLRRSNADKRRAVQRLLDDEEWAKWTDSEIARRCSVNQSTVTRIRHESSPMQSISERTYTTKHGTIATMNTSRIGSSGGSGSPSSTASSTTNNITDNDTDNDTDDTNIAISNATGKSAFDPHGKPEDRSDEHYTPEYIWRLALDCLGVDKFDLDPCSNSHHSPNVPAANIFTKEDDGLKQKWEAKTLWLNPPYSDTKAWIARLIWEYQAMSVEEAVALVKGDFSTQWFQPLLEFPICLVNHRVKFENEDNNGGGAKFASAIVYLGNNIEKFYLTFDTRYSSDSGIGTVVQAGIRGVHFGE